MDRSMLPPSEQIVRTMSRIYRGGMTTTSGGNISIRAEDGDIWITPAGVDKGRLTDEDIVRVRPDGTLIGVHRPSSELPFHQAIYAGHPELNAIIHAHPPALVSFSIVRQVPDTRVIPQADFVCGSVGYASYELPGSEALGRRIADAFEEGHRSVVMENHGTVVAGIDLSDTFQRFETLEFCARTIIKARQIGNVNLLDESQVALFEHRDHLLPEFHAESHPADERALRAEICRFVRRAMDQRLMISTYGTVSVRFRDDDFLITPTGIDRLELSSTDIVLIRGGRREGGKVPSRSVRIHQQIYRKHPEIHCVISTQSPNATAFCVAGMPLNTRTIPESYLLLKEVPLLPFGCQFNDNPTIPDTLSPKYPILLVQNDAIVVGGSSLLETFDRLEVAEFSARSVIDSRVLGEMVPMDDDAIARLRQAFHMT